MIEHKEEKLYVPEMIFGHLLTSSNYNDEDKKVTGMYCISYNIWILDEHVYQC